MESLTTGWIALALHYVEGVDLADATSLSRLISAADMIEHAVVSYDEVVAGLAELAARGWLTIDGSSCALAAAVQPIVATSIEDAGYPSPRAMTEVLGKHARFVEPAVPVIDRATFAEATRLYLERLDAILKKKR